VVSLDSYLDRLTRKQLEQAVAVLALDKGVDLVTGGRLNKLTKKVLLATAKRLVPFAGRAGLSVGGAALGASRILMTNPYVLGATAVYVGYQERERIKQLLDQGYEFVEERLPTPPLPPSPGIPSPTIPGVSEIITSFEPAITRPKRPSSFNKAVKAGMLAVKKDKAYGGKGKIKPAKKAFSVVVKLAAAKKKKKKAPKSGLRRRIWNAMKGLR
jgi:hypothetical protein